MVMFTEKLSKQVERAKKRNKAAAAKVQSKAVKVKVKQVVQETLPLLSTLETVPPGSRRLRAKAKPLKTIMNNPDEAHLIDNGVKMIEQKYTHLQSSLYTALIDAADIGDLLYHIKSLLKFGELTPWVEATMPFHPRTGQNYMALARHRKDLLRKGITSIVDAYAAIRGVPTPDEFIDSDDSPNTDDRIDDRIVVESSIVNLDDIKLPTKRAQGAMDKAVVCEETIAAIKEQTFPYENSKETYKKIVINLPVSKGNEHLIGEFVIAAQTLLQPGGKIIFHRRAKG